MPNWDCNGSLDVSHVKPTLVPDSAIPTGPKASWSKISGFWIGKHDLFETCHPHIYQIGRSGDFYSALAFGQTLEPSIWLESMRDLRGGQVVVRLYKPGTDQTVYYSLEKNRLIHADLPDTRHKAYWVYMIEKAFAHHRMTEGALPRPANYLDALRGIPLADALELMVGRTKARQLLEWETTEGKKIKLQSQWAGGIRADARLRAISRLSDLKLFHDYASRAVALIVNPCKLDQDRFGVCGMASAIYATLSLQPNRFVDILKAVFNSETFLAGGGKVKPQVKIIAQSANYAEVVRQIQQGPSAQCEPQPDINTLLAERVNQYKTKKKGEQLKTHAKLDFIVSRSLAKMLKILDSAAYEDQKQFTVKFESESSSMGSKFGDMAFTEHGIQLLLSDVIGVSEMYFMLHVNAVKDMVTDQVNWFTKHGAGSFAIAAVNDPNKWVTGKGNALTAPWNPAGQKYDFAHWIVLNDKITDQGGSWDVPVWTWAQSTLCPLPKAFAEGHLYSIILAYMKPE